MCIYDDCSVIASYNYRGEKTRLYCAFHKLPDMVNINQVQCKLCNRSAFYNYPGIYKRAYCSDHKKDNMVSYSGMKCEYIGCKKYATYGFLDGPALFCDEHKLPDMKLYNEYTINQHTYKRLLNLEIINDDPIINELFSY